METNHNIIPNSSNISGQIKVSLIVVGIMTAIICAMALLYESHTPKFAAANIIETADLVPTQVPATIVNRIIASATW